MKVWNKPLSQNRQVSRTAVLTIFLVVLAGVAYAASRFVGDLVCGPFYMEADGTVLNEDGDTVGWTELWEDGIAITTIQDRNRRIYLDSKDQTEGAISLAFQPIENNDGTAPEAPKDDE